MRFTHHQREIHDRLSRGQVLYANGTFEISPGRYKRMHPLALRGIEGRGTIERRGDRYELTELGREMCKPVNYKGNYHAT